MKWLAPLLVFAAVALHAQDSERDVAKISEAMGHMIGKNLQALGLDLDITAIVKGLKDAADGKSPPMNEDECVQAIASIQEESYSLAAEKNRKTADAFLALNQKEEGVVSLENGKLQYKIVKLGEGQTVESYNSPIVRYTARYLDGQVFGTAAEEELVSLNEAIPGFSKGVVGMKEGEIRTLYLHPDLGYGNQGHLLPNALLVFEVEVIKADASADAQAASNKDESLPILQSALESANLQ